MKAALLWSLAVLATTVALLVVPDDGGCSGPTAHWLVLEPLAQAVGIKPYFRADGIFGPYIGAVLAVAVPGFGALGWALARNREAREAGEGRGGALFVGASGIWLVFVGLWGWWCWPG